jgi:hypothetical protein
MALGVHLRDRRVDACEGSTLEQPTFGLNRLTGVGRVAFVRPELRQSMTRV